MASVAVGMTMINIDVVDVPMSACDDDAACDDNEDDDDDVVKRRRQSPCNFDLLRAF
jgi:hypothetical protein